MSYTQAMKHFKNHRKDRFYQQCSGYASFKETETEVKETVNALYLLDEIDELRRKHEHDQQQNNDWVLRVACAIIAQAAGYQSRVDWQDALKADSTTKYSKYYSKE